MTLKELKYVFGEDPCAFYKYTGSVDASNWSKSITIALVEQTDSGVVSQINKLEDGYLVRVTSEHRVDHSDFELLFEIESPVVKEEVEEEVEEDQPEEGDE